jgi:hypothetical protein
VDVGHADDAHAGCGGPQPPDDPAQIRRHPADRGRRAFLVDGGAAQWLTSLPPMSMVISRARWCRRNRSAAARCEAAPS